MGKRKIGEERERGGKKRLWMVIELCLGKGFLVGLEFTR